MISELTNLITVFSNVPITNKTLVFSGILVVGILIYKIIDDNKHQKYYEDMKNEKNKEIERLADDNRRYRDIYLKSFGISQAQVDTMSAANVKEN